MVGVSSRDKGSLRAHFRGINAWAKTDGFQARRDGPTLDLVSTPPSTPLKQVRVQPRFRQRIAFPSAVQYIAPMRIRYAHRISGCALSVPPFSSRTLCASWRTQKSGHKEARLTEVTSSQATARSYR